MNRRIKMRRIVKVAFVLLLTLTLTGCLGDNTEYTSKDKYTELNIQEMHNDYDSNEIAAKDKYSNNYYYFTEVVDDIESFGGDTYLEFMIHSSNSNTKTSGIELNAYFENGDMLKDVKKGDTVTVYCKFEKRSIENYMGTSAYSLHSCHFGDMFTQETE